MALRKPDSRVVYSTEHGRMCPGCGKPEAACACSKKAAAPKGAPTGDGVVRISRQTKGRKGAGVCVVTGLPLTGERLGALAKELKQLCGSGGTVKDQTIEIQGEHRDRLAAHLRKLGYTVKLAGG